MISISLIDAFVAIMTLIALAMLRYIWQNRKRPYSPRSVEKVERIGKRRAAERNWRGIK